MACASCNRVHVFWQRQLFSPTLLPCYLQKSVLFRAPRCRKVGRRAPRQYRPQQLDGVEKGFKFEPEAPGGAVAREVCYLVWRRGRSGKAHQSPRRLILTEDRGIYGDRQPGLMNPGAMTSGQRRGKARRRRGSSGAKTSCSIMHGACDKRRLTGCYHTPATSSGYHARPSGRSGLASVLTMGRAFDRDGPKSALPCMTC